MKTKNKVYGWGIVLTLIGLAGMKVSTSFIMTAVFSAGYALILYSYADMVSPKHKDPYRNL